MAKQQGKAQKKPDVHRTMIALEHDLWQAVRKHAFENETTYTQVIKDAIKAYINRK